MFKFWCFIKQQKETKYYGTEILPTFIISVRGWWYMLHVAATAAVAAELSLKTIKFFLNDVFNIHTELNNEKYAYRQIN